MNARSNPVINNITGNQNGDNTQNHDQVATAPTSASLRVIKMIPKIANIEYFISFNSVVNVIVSYQDF